MDILSDKIVTARKKHRCMLCGGVIEKGEKYNRATIIDGDIYDFICHKHCKALMSLLDMEDDGDGINENDFTIYVQDYVTDKHPDWDYKNIAECAKRIYEELKKEKE